MKHSFVFGIRLAGVLHSQRPAKGQYGQQLCVKMG